jgi:hypothetical protein
MSKTFLFSVLLLFQMACGYKPSPAVEVVLPSEQIASLEVTSTSNSFINSWPINNEGGHLQGIQPLYQDQQSYLVLSGSSSTYSYYAMIRLGESPQVIGIQKILDKPFKHAGGFQIYDHYMAVGVEDNDARNHSYVFIFDLADPESPPAEPVLKIEREGPFERATAGCIGLTFYQDHWLIVVGDWNTRNLDFYQSSEIGNEITPFKLTQSITISEIDKKLWSDPEWLPYQNINLLHDSSRLYLVGLTSDSEKNNVVDVYEIITEDLASFSLQKISRKILNNQGGDFIWGAGLDIKNESIVGIVSCQRNLDSLAQWYYYSKQD